MLSLNWMLPKRFRSGGLADDLMIITMIVVIGGGGYRLYTWWSQGEVCQHEAFAPKVVVVSCPASASNE